MMEPTILHADLDAFYASAEQLIDPALRGRPVAVGGGVVLAASYEARAFGVKAPMPARDARKLCPGLIVVDGHFGKYLDLSDQVMQILGDTTPVLEQISIDEAFLDVRGTTHLLGSPSAIGNEVRRRVREEVGLPLSVGIATTKFLAKIASARAKPDGMVIVHRGMELEFLHPLPVEAMWGVGAVTSARLHSLGIETVGDLAATPSEAMATMLGNAAGRSLHALAWNRDPRRVVSGRRAGSVGSQQALGRGTSDLDELAVVVLGLADRIGRRLRKKGRSGRTLTVRVRFPGPRNVTRSHTLQAHTSSTSAIAALGTALLERAVEGTVEPATLVGLSVSALTTDDHLQLVLDLGHGDVLNAGSEADMLRRALDEHIDAVRERFGRDLLQIGINRRGGMVAEGFRELSEKD